MKRIYSAIVMLVMAVTVSAQEAQEKNVEKPMRSYYLDIAAGVNYTMSENTRLYPMGDIIRHGESAAFGIQFNPYWSTNLQLAYNRDFRIYYNGLLTNAAISRC